MTKREIVMIGMITVAVSFADFLAVEKLISNNAQKTSDQLIEAFDTVDQNMAITQLSELRGMILEVESLSHEDISQSLLLDELEGITAPKHFTNPYLKDFTFIIPNTSNVGELCGELISQIDNQIHTIEYGAKGE